MQALHIYWKNKKTKFLLKLMLLNVSCKYIIALACNTGLSIFRFSIRFNRRTHFEWMQQHVMNRLNTKTWLDRMNLDKHWLRKQTQKLNLFEIANNRTKKMMIGATKLYWWKKDKKSSRKIVLMFTEIKCLLNEILSVRNWLSTNKGITKIVFNNKLLNCQNLLE